MLYIFTTESEYMKKVTGHNSQNVVVIITQSSWGDLFAYVGD